MEKDFYSNTFFSDNERYADIINAFGCDGKPFIKGKDLQELDTRTYLGRQWEDDKKADGRGIFIGIYYESPPLVLISQLSVLKIRKKLIMHCHFG